MSPQLKARQAEFEAIQKKTAESMDRLFEKLIEVASRKEKAIFRIDAKANRVTATVPVTVADSEASITAGSGGSSQRWRSF